MRKLLLAFVLLLLICSNVFPVSTLESYFDQTSGDLRYLSNDFVSANTPIVNAPIGVAQGGGQILYNSFRSDMCGESWTSSNSSSLFSHWLVPSITAFMIVAIGLAILHMVAQVFNSPALSGLVKEEIFQGAMTIARVVFLVALVLSGDLLFQIRSPALPDRVYSDSSGSKEIIDASMAFTRLMISDVTTHYSMLLIYNDLIHTLYSANLTFGISYRAQYSFNLGAILRPLIDVLGLTLQSLSLALGEWVVHLITLCFIKKYTFTLFVPAGILLRSLPYTRAAGEALLSLGIALAFFYPITFIIDYEAHKILSTSLIDASSSVRSFISGSGLLNVTGAVLVSIFLMGGVFIPFFLGSALNLAFEMIRGAVYYIVIMSLVLPVVNIFLTLTVAREMSRFFRSDVNFLSFLKII
jgi:hypothetical protein